MPRGDTKKIYKCYNSLNLIKVLHVNSPFGQGVARTRCPGTVT